MCKKKENVPLYLFDIHTQAGDPRVQLLSKKPVVRGVGFEPTNPYGTAASGHINIGWSCFKDYLQKHYRPITAKCRYHYALRYHKLLLNEDFSTLNIVSDHTRVHILKALCVLSKFLGKYNEFKATMQKYGLKWSVNNKDDLIIARMLKPLNSASVVDWVREAQAKVPEVQAYVDLMLYTGLRPLEGIDSFNLIIRLQRDGRLCEYYDLKKQMLQHFKYREIFIRRSKKVYISFVPHELLQPIFNCKPIVRRTTYKHLEKKQLPVRFCDIREYWATYMSKFLTRPEIDFLQGRVTGSIFMINYFNPSYVSDLQTRAINASNKLLQQVKQKSYVNSN
jgi:hypothetical protein